MKKLQIQSAENADTGLRRVRVDLLPVLAKSGYTRGERKCMTTLLKERQNHLLAWFVLEMILYANFGPQDWFVTMTYDEDHLPPNWRGAEKKPPNFLRKVREARNSKGLPYAYVYVHECLHGDGRPHHHMVIKAADGDRDLLQTAWRNGHIDICTIEEFGGYQKLAKYITKEPRKKGKIIPGKRMWTPSLGLIKPQCTELIVPDNYQYTPPYDAAPVDEGLGITSKVPGWLYGEFPRWDMLTRENPN